MSTHRQTVLGIHHPLQLLDTHHQVLVTHLQTMDILLQTLGTPHLMAPIHHHLAVTLLQMPVLTHLSLVDTHHQALVTLLPLPVDTLLQTADMVGTPLLIVDTPHLLKVHIPLPTLVILQVAHTLQGMAVTLRLLLAGILLLVVATRSLLLLGVTLSRLQDLNIHLLVVAICPQQVDILQLQVDMVPQLQMAYILKRPMVTILQMIVVTHQLIADTRLQQVKGLVKVLVLVAVYLHQAATMGILSQLPAMTALRYYLDSVEHIIDFFS